MTDQEMMLNRRNFVKLGAGMGMASGMAAAAMANEEEKSASEGMKYRTLGRTGLKVSEVSFGSYGFNNSELLQEALDKGVNLICTAAEYQRGVAEEAIGRVMKTRRKDAILFTGWRCRPNSKKEELLKTLDESLKRLQTDYIDIIKSHFIEDPAWLDNDEQYAAFEAAKKAGKAGFLSLSVHSGNLEDILKKAIEKNTFDVIQCKYNFMEFPAQKKLFEEAAKQGIGAIVFKIGAGNMQDEIRGLEEKGFSVGQAGIRWALSNQDVSSVCVTIRNFNQINEYCEAVTKKLSQADVELLRRYAQAVDQTYCRYCSTCEPHCPYGVSVANVMRYSMYFKYYKMEKEAMQLYAQLPFECRPDACENCPAPCEKRCPHQRSVREGLLEAKRLLKCANTISVA
jgi:predicted aldo/keto reductase-like oxidoreductase